VPRLQRSAITEFGEMLSAEVARGDWQQLDGEAINAKAKILNSIWNI
jgi:hypothetical protein